MKSVITKSHVSVIEFAFRKMVYTNSVYSAIAQGKIKPDYAGERRALRIDLRKYGNYKFGVHNPDKAAMVRWYVSVDYKIKEEKLKRKLMGRYGLKREELTKPENKHKTRATQYRSLNGFTDWCYNRFVEHNRKSASSDDDIYYEILQKHYLWNLKHPQFAKQRARAKQLLQRILKAITTDTLNSLPYTGAEGKSELEQQIYRYKTQLMQQGYSEEQIKKLIRAKRKELKQ